MNNPDHSLRLALPGIDGSTRPTLSQQRTPKMAMGIHLTIVCPPPQITLYGLQIGTGLELQVCSALNSTKWVLQKWHCPVALTWKAVV